jgi:hypothetical protein
MLSWRLVFRLSFLSAVSRVTVLVLTIWLSLPQAPLVLMAGAWLLLWLPLRGHSRNPERNQQIRTRAR